MRTMLALVLVGAMTASCGDEGGELAVDARFQLSCPVDPAETGCGSALPPVDLLGFDGETDDASGREIQVTCSALDTGAGTKSVRFSIGYGRDPLIEVAGLVIPAGGGTPSGTSCRLTATQGGNTFGGRDYGACGAATPSAAQPCQFGSFAFNPSGDAGRELTTSLLCRNLRSDAAPNDLVRDITLPMNSSSPAVIKLINCDGI